MFRMKYVGVTMLCLSFCAASLPAQTRTHMPSRTSPVLAQSGGYQLTEEMIQRVLQFWQILAFNDFSPSEAAAIRADLIANFRKDPASQTQGYQNIVKFLQQEPASALTGKRSWLSLALLRATVWQAYGQQPQAFREFKNHVYGRMVLKYNPVLVNSGGVIVTKADVDCQLYADALVAQAAGVAPPLVQETGRPCSVALTAARDQFIRSFPSRFDSLPEEQQRYLKNAEIRVATFDIVYRQTIQTRAVVTADIRRNVHSSADVSREARQVENDSVCVAIGATLRCGKYWQGLEKEERAAVLNAFRINTQLIQMGSTVRENSNRQMQESSK